MPTAFENLPAAPGEADQPTDYFSDSFFHEPSDLSGVPKEAPAGPSPSRLNSPLNRIRAQDLTARGIPTYRNASGDVSEVKDESGQALTGLSTRTGIAYDSQGQPKQISYDETGGPKISNPFDKIPATTDPKTGAIEKYGPGGIYQYVGQDPDVTAKLQQKASDKELGKEAGLLGRKLTLDEHDALEGKKSSKALYDQLADPQTGIPTLPNPQTASPEDFHKAIDEHFDTQYAAPEANAKSGFFGSGELTPQAQALRAQIDSDKATAHDKADQLYALKDKMGALGESISQHRQNLNDQVSTLLAHQEGRTGPLDQPPQREDGTPTAGPAGELYPPQEDWARMLGGKDAVDQIHDQIGKGNVPPIAAPAAVATVHDIQDAQQKADDLKESDPTLAEKFKNVAANLLNGLNQGINDLTKAMTSDQPFPGGGADPLNWAPKAVSDLERKAFGKSIGDAIQAGTAKAAAESEAMVDQRLKGTLAAKTSNIVGGLTPYVLTALATKGTSIATPLMATMFYSTGYQRTLEDAKAHGASPLAAEGAATTVGVVNALLAMPLRVVGKAAEAIFGDTAPKIIERQIQNAFQAGGVAGVNKIVGAMAQYLKEGRAGAYTGKAVQEVGDALDNLMGELKKTPLQRMATVAKTAAQTAALGAGVQTTENLVKKTYNPDQGTFEGVPEQALVFGGLGAVSEGFKQVADAREAKQALDIINSKKGPAAGPTPALPAPITPKPPSGGEITPTKGGETPNEQPSTQGGIPPSTGKGAIEGKPAGQPAGTEVEKPQPGNANAPAAGATATEPAKPAAGPATATAERQPVLSHEPATTVAEAETRLNRLGNQTAVRETRKAGLSPDQQLAELNGHLENATNDAAAKLPASLPIGSTVRLHEGSGPLKVVQSDEEKTFLKPESGGKTISQDTPTVRSGIVRGHYSYAPATEKLAKDAGVAQPLEREPEPEGVRGESEAGHKRPEKGVSQPRGSGGGEVLRPEGPAAEEGAGKGAGPVRIQTAEEARAGVEKARQVHAAEEKKLGGVEVVEGKTGRAGIATRRNGSAIMVDHDEIAQSGWTAQGIKDAWREELGHIKYLRAVGSQEKLTGAKIWAGMTKEQKAAAKVFYPDAKDQIERAAEWARMVEQFRATGRVTEGNYRDIEALKPLLEGEQSPFLESVLEKMGGTEKAPSGASRPERTVVVDKLPPGGWTEADKVPSPKPAAGRPVEGPPPKATKLQVRARELADRMAALPTINPTQAVVIRTLLRSGTGAALDQAEAKIGKLEEKYAPTTGKQPSGEREELPRIPTRTDVRPNASEIREKESEQATGGRGPVERPTSSEKQQPGPRQSGQLDEKGNKALDDAFEGLFAGKPLAVPPGEPPPEGVELPRGVRYDGKMELGGKVLEQFTDYDPDSPSHGATFYVNAKDLTTESLAAKLAQKKAEFSPLSAGKPLGAGRPYNAEEAKAQAKWLEKQAGLRGSTIASMAQNKPALFDKLAAGWRKLHPFPYTARVLRGEAGKREWLAAGKPTDQQAVPPEKLAGFIAAAQEMIRQGIDTPEKLVSVLEEKFQGKAHPFSQAFWDAIGMVRPDLRQTVDWSKLREPALQQWRVNVNTDENKNVVKTVSATSAEEAVAIAKKEPDVRVVHEDTARMVGEESPKPETPSEVAKVVTEGIEGTPKAQQKQAKTQIEAALNVALEKAPDVDPTKMLYPSSAAKELGTIDIAVPGDGEFTVINAKPAIEQVLSKVKSMETGKRISRAPKTSGGRGATEIESYADQLVAKYGLTSAIADQENQLRQIDPESPAGTQVRRTIAELHSRQVVVEVPKQKEGEEHVSDETGAITGAHRAGEEPGTTQNIGGRPTGIKGARPFPTRESFQGALANELAAKTMALRALRVGTREIEETRWPGLGYSWLDKAILYNSEALEATVNGSSDAAEALKASINEEVIHGADHRTGDSFVEYDRAMFRAVEPNLQELVKQHYGDGDEDEITLGMEYIRMLAQIRAGQPITESFYRDTSLLEQALAQPQSEEAEKAAERIIKALGWTTTGEPLGAGKPPTMQTLKKQFAPGLDILGNVKEGIQSLLLPGAVSPEHLRAAELVGSKLGPMHRAQEIAKAKLQKDWMTFEKLGVHRDDVPLVKNPGMQFMSDLSQGRTVSKELSATRERIDALFSKRIDDLDKAGAPLETVRENYFPGIWTLESRRAFNQAIGEAISSGVLNEDFNANDLTPDQEKWVREKVNDLLDKGQGSDKDALRYFSKRPLKGRESFRKAKVFDDIMTAVKLGLIPASANPIDLVWLKLAEMDKSIMANRVFQELKAREELRVIKPTERVPEGWEKVNDRYGVIYGPPDMAAPKYVGIPILGYRIVPKSVADVLNNYLSSSLYNNRYFGSLYTGWMGTASALNQTQLGVGSAFHAGFTTAEAQVSANANIIKDIYGLLRGNRSLSDLLATFRTASTASVGTAVTGDKILNAWRNPDGVIDERIAQVVRAAEIAGAGFKMEHGLRTEQSAKFLSDWLNGHRIRAARRSPIAFVEMLAKPIMDYLVPRQKTGVFAQLVWRIIEMNPDKTLEELRPELRQAWNRVDARLGQVRYDRLFMNNVAKNVVQGTVRAPGWSGGTIAELGGAFKDAYTFFEEFAKTGKLPRDLPDRVAYLISLLVTVAALNGILTFLFTGDKPEGLDYLAFRTGGKDLEGNPERFLLPSYVKDLLAYVKAPFTTLINKSHPLLSVFGDLIKNKDYYGVQIRDEDRNAIVQLGEAGAYFIKAFTPFWIRGATKTVQQGGLTPKALLPLIGVMPAPRKIAQTPAEALADKINQATIPGAPITEQQAERRIEKSRAVSELRRHVALNVSSLLAKGTLKPSDVRLIYQRAQMAPLASQINHMTLENAEKVYQRASLAERAQLTAVMARKRANAAKAGRSAFSGF